MPERRRRFSPQFKAEAVEMGRPIVELARIRVSMQNVRKLGEAWRCEHPEPEQPLTPVERARVKRWKTRSVGCGWKTSS